MDCNQVIRQLILEKEKLQRAIEQLERLEVAPQIRSRRDRKSMSAVEREEVSARMKKYWAARGQKGEKKGGGNKT